MGPRRRMLSINTFCFCTHSGPGYFQQLVTLSLLPSFGYSSKLQAPTVFVGASIFFSGKHFGAINGMILAGMGIGGSFGPWLGGFLYDLFGSYQYAFGIAMLCFALSALAFVIAAPRQKIVFNPA